MTTRLTISIRESLTRDIMRHRFTPDVDDLLSTQAVFAARVYDNLFNADMQIAMNGVPPGWLPEVNHIGVQFGLQYVNLYFSGYLSGKLGQLQTKREGPEITKRVPASKSGGCAKAYDALHLLSVDFDRIRNRTKTLRETVDTAKRSIETAIAKASTTNRLVEMWPEIAEFVRKYDTEKPPLPALPTDHLNQLLRLP